MTVDALETADDLITALKDCPANVLASAVWEMPFGAYLTVRRLQDSTGQYLWESHQGCRWGLLLGVPVVCCTDDGPIYLGPPRHQENAWTVSGLDTALPGRIAGPLRTLLTHGWGELRVIVVNHEILKVYLTTTEK